MKTKTLFIFAIAAVMIGCNGNGVLEPKTLKLNSQQQQMLQVSNDFSFDLLREVRAIEEKENIVLSPLSASFAFGMVMNGVNGKTLEEIQNALGFEDDYSIEDINEYYKELLSKLPYLDKSNTLKIANSIWVQEEFEFYDSFIKTNKYYFSALVENINFRDSKNSAEKINRWAARNTNNLIKEIVQPKDIANMVMILANALYFKGKWSSPFKEEYTKPFDFTTSKSQTIQVPMMQKSGDYQYADIEGGQLLEMNYKEGQYCMDILLPSQENNLSQMLASLDAEQWDEWIRSLKTYNVSIRFPKLKTTYKVDLVEPLKAIGIENAFNPLTADFRNMSSEALYIDYVKQNCFLSVDEEGTKAAAVTHIGIPYPSAPEPNPHRDFFVDRPYLMVIREKQYGTILFTASIGNPQ